MRAGLKIIELGPGRSLFIESAGAGMPVVLVHGALATHTDWPVEFRAWLAARARTIAIDRPGHGESARPRFAASARAQATQIRAALERTGVGSAVLVGHSMGGLVSLAYAEQFPDSTAGLVLVSPICFPEWRPVEHLMLAPRALALGGPFISQAAAGVDPLFLRIVQRLMFWPQPTPEDWQRRYPYKQVLTREHMLEEGEDALAVAPTYPGAWLDLRAIEAPMHILVGDADQIADPNRHGKALALLAREAEIEVLAGMGHMLHHCAEPRLRRAVERMLAKTGAAIAPARPRLRRRAPGSDRGS